MKRIISQEIPVEVINKDKYVWNPFANTITLDGKTVQGTPESTTRYQKLLNDFDAQRGIDKYTKDTYIDRKFNDEMEISLKDAETLFDSFLSAPELKTVAKMISKRLGRKLEAYDIWYDGFKPRSNMDETKLNEQTRALYPNAEAMKKDLPNILMKAGFSKEKANYIAEKVAVDPARGSGHAWGTAMLSRAGPRYLRGSNSAGFSAKVLRIAAVIAKRLSESMLILQTADFAALRSCSSGIPTAASSLPPYLLIVSTSS